MKIRVSPHPLGITAKATEYMGPARFDAFRLICTRVGLRYDRDAKINIGSVDAVSPLLDELKRNGFVAEVQPGILEAIEKNLKVVKAHEDAANDRLEIAEKRLAGTGLALYPFQREGVIWLAGRRMGLLGDAMGLGKTVQALIALPERPHALAFAPAGVKVNWARETKRWRPDLFPIVVVPDSMPERSKGRLIDQGYGVLPRAEFRWPLEGEIVIANYDLLPANIVTAEGQQCAVCGHNLVDHDVEMDLYPERPAGACRKCKCRQHLLHTDKKPKTILTIEGAPPERMNLIADEAHLLKNFKASRSLKWRAVRDAGKTANVRIWLLTGTPLLNNPHELRAVLSAASLDSAFGGYKQFLEAFGARKSKFGNKFTQPRSVVRDVLQRVMLRRERETVLKDLPEKRWQFLRVDVDAKTLHACDRVGLKWKQAGLDIDAIAAKVAIAQKEGKGGEEAAKQLKQLMSVAFEEISAARAELARAKTDPMLELVDAYEEAGDPVVVASCHRFPVDKLSERKGWGRISGSETPEQRAEIVAAFQAEDSKQRGVALTVRAGGMGITLTRASNMIFVDQDWTPGMNDQAEDRIMRIGQKRACLYTILVADHYVDYRVAEILAAKVQLFDQTIKAAAVKTIVPRSESLQKAADAIVRLEHAKPFPNRAVLRGRPSPSSTKRAAVSDLEREAAQGIVHLASMDEDRATDLNAAGFSKIDGEIGHSLARQFQQGGALTDTQWRVVLRLATKYRRQLGA